MSERGSASVELAILAGPLLVVMLFLVALGRMSDARLDLTNAAWDAARAASQRRTVAAAEMAARETATAAVGERCAQLEVDVDTDAFAPGGVVTVDLTCTVSLDDLSGLRAPGSKVLYGHAVAVVDAFRGTR